MRDRRRRSFSLCELRDDDDGLYGFGFTPLSLPLDEPHFELRVSRLPL